MSAVYGAADSPVAAMTRRVVLNPSDAAKCGSLLTSSLGMERGSCERVRHRAGLCNVAAGGSDVTGGEGDRDPEED